MIVAPSGVKVESACGYAYARDSWVVRLVQTWRYYFLKYG